MIPVMIFYIVPYLIAWCVAWGVIWVIVNKLNYTNLCAIFRWFDVWVGVYPDMKKRRLYVFPVPMFGFLIDFGEGER